MTCTAEGDFGAITPDAALCVYRIAQEALRNVIAHAGASGVEVRLLQMGHDAQITIADDGRGFDAANRGERDTGLGLVSMSERARIIGGTVSIVSARQQGTRVQATIPMNARVKLDVGIWHGRTGRMTRRHTVLLADDHTIVTDGLSRIWERPDSRWSGRFATASISSTPPRGFAPTSSSPTSRCQGSRVSMRSLV